MFTSAMVVVAACKAGDAGSSLESAGGREVSRVVPGAGIGTDAGEGTVESFGGFRWALARLIVWVGDSGRCGSQVSVDTQAAAELAQHPVVVPRRSCLLAASRHGLLVGIQVK